MSWSLKLIGNSTWDKIYKDEELICERPGGIMNIARNLWIKFDLYPTETIECPIFLGINGCKSYTLSNRNDKLLNHSFCPTTWTHISYLDQIDIWPDNVQSEIITADLCATSYSDSELGRIYKKLSFISTLIISEDELKALRCGIDTLTHLLRAGGIVIVRYKNYVRLYSPSSTTQEWPNKFIAYQNSVGAGDAFIAEFLNQFIGQRYSTTTTLPPQLGYQEIIPMCVEASIKYLNKQNEKI